MKVVRTSVFPASKEEVFCKLQKLSLLQYIAKPYATFTPVGEQISVWKAGVSSAYKLRLFGIIPFGTHRINVISFDIAMGYIRMKGMSMFLYGIIGLS